jgi:hypothetical protein
VRNTNPAQDDWGAVSRIVTSIGGPLLVQEVRSLFSLKTTVFPSTIGVGPSTILAPGTSEDPAHPGLRRGLYIFNNAVSRTLFICLVFRGPPVPDISLFNFTLKLLPQALYTMPFPMFLGEIWGAWDGLPDPFPNNNAQVTDIA